MNCKQCGTRVDAMARFCHRCGASLVDDLSDDISNGLSTNHSIVTNQIASSGSVKKETKKKSFFGGIHHPWRRLFARTVDVMILGVLVFLLVSYLIGNLFPSIVETYVEALNNIFLTGILLYIFWIPVEALFISLLGATPAKWVFGIQVRDVNGRKLTYWTALARTLYVWMQGEGLGIPIVALFTRVFAYNRLTSTGTTLWDTEVGSVVSFRKFGFFRAIFSTLLVICTIAFMGIINSM